jgi:hypothetical protein
MPVSALALVSSSRQPVGISSRHRLLLDGRFVAKDGRCNLSESACAKSRARCCADEAVGGIAAARA